MKPMRSSKETESLIDEIMIHAKINAAGETWQPLQDGTIDRKKWIALLRHRSTELIEERFKDGIELPQEGAFLHPGNMINLIANYSETGEKRKHEDGSTENLS
jgi:hypothetical protein